MIKVVLRLAVLVALGLGLLWWLALPMTPDAFYDHPQLADAKPGMLLRQEIFTRNVPLGTKAWRILYATTRMDGTPAIASAIVVVPEKALAPAPVVAWAHGTTGVARGCAPSLFKDPFPYIPAFPALFNEGWAFVATDYVGQGTQGGHAYLLGEDAARNVLDSIRAAHFIKEASLDSRTLIWGHSQGGHSALWAGMRATAYAPELKIAGVAALAPASDLQALMEKGRALPFGKILSAYVIDAYARFYADIRAKDLTTAWSGLLARDMARRCVGGWGTLLSLVEAKLAPSEGLFKRDALTGPLAARLDQNTPRDPISAPLFVGQGLADDLVFPEVQNAYIKQRCAASQSLHYHSYAGRDHLSLVAADSPLSQDLVVWSKARLAGEMFLSQCPG